VDYVVHRAHMDRVATPVTASTQGIRGGSRHLRFIAVQHFYGWPAIVPAGQVRRLISMLLLRENFS
jgi:hypothetical protein